MSRPMDSTLTLVQDPNNVHYGDVINFAYTVGDKVQNPVALYLTVTQNGQVVATGGGFPPEMWMPITLSSRLWTEGEGDAVAQLVSFRPGQPDKGKVLAEVSFHVLA